MGNIPRAPPSMARQDRAPVAPATYHHPAASSNDKRYLPNSRQMAQNLSLYASQDPFAQVSYLVVTLFLEGRWDASSKTPTASNSVICFRVELHLGAKPTRHSGADSRTAKDLPSPCGGRRSRRGRRRNENGKSHRNRRILLSSQRSESVGALVPTAPGNLDPAIERRGFRLAARGRPHRLLAFS